MVQWDLAKVLVRVRFPVSAFIFDSGALVFSKELILLVLLTTTFKYNYKDTSLYLKSDTMLTKTELAILTIFTAKITQRFSIKQIADQLKKPYPLIHRSIQSLLSNSFLEKDEHQLISLQYKKHHA